MMSVVMSLAMAICDLFHMIAQALAILFGFGIWMCKANVDAALYRAAHKKTSSRFVDRRLARRKRPRLGMIVNQPSH